MNKFHDITDTLENILDSIGQTPVIKLNRIVPPDSATIWAKLENLNPSGSIKERTALNMINAAEKNGLLKPESTIVDATFGNTGIGFALVAVMRGYKLIVTMPAGMSDEKRQILKAYGAEIIDTPKELGIEGAIKKAKEISKNIGDSYMPDQFTNIENPNTHRRNTGPEILEQIPGKIDAFVAGVQSGGTLTGVGEALRGVYPDIDITAVEPKESAVLSGDQPSSQSIEGLGAGFIPKVLNRDIYNRIIKISHEDAREFTLELARKEGLLVGISSGAAALAAIKVGKELGKGKQVVTIFSDSGERYLSTGLFE